MSESNAAFATLGKHLKYVREQSNQSLAEVSGAVEIDENTLARIEAGKERPSEDILLLLISYFDVQEQEAVQLWELANYDSDIPEQLRADSEARLAGKPVIMLMAMDMRTVYSDGLDIIAGKTGLTLNFTQAGGNEQAAPVARVGMSYDQAQQVIEQLQLAVMKAKYLGSPRALPPQGKNTSSGKNPKE